MQTNETPNTTNTTPSLTLVAGLTTILSALNSAKTEIDELLEDMCDEPEEDISANRTIVEINEAVALVEKLQALQTNAPAMFNALKWLTEEIGDAGNPQHPSCESIAEANSIISDIERAAPPAAAG